MNTSIFTKMGLTKHVSRAGLQIRKYSPEILTTVGIIGVGTSAVMACRATLGLEGKLDELNERKAVLAHLKEHEEKTPENEMQHKQDNVAIHTKFVVDIVKLYGPAVTLGLASVGCIIGAHGIMKKRNAALAVAYNAVEKTFAEYRKRVEEKLGEDGERDIRMAVFEETIEDEATGKEKTVSHLDPNGFSQYARVFDELNENWNKIPEYNLMFLRCQQNYTNDLLKARGHLFLNEVYDVLDLPRTQAGAVVGWIYGDEGSDDFVDFGIFDLGSMEAREFVNGYEKAIWLDFNVQGTIFDRI